MRMALGRKEASAIEIVLYLANEACRRPVKAREIASQVHISPSYLPQVLANLVRGGLLTARAGRNGGYRLNRSPTEITLVDIIESAGDVQGDELCQLSGTPTLDNACALHGTWIGARSLLKDQLGGTSITDLANGVEMLRTGRSVSG
jgi:Rrf2 family iron-sulfur cluster assembly transcriptional regulator